MSRYQIWVPSIGLFKMNTFKQKLHDQYQHHADAFEKKLENGTVDIWIDPNNADYWGNMLPMEPLMQPFSILPSSSILTLGDGKGGKEAVFFKNLKHHVTASDVAVSVLQHVHKSGVIDDYLEVDAENISLPDNSFDFVITKETLHHLPRPYNAIYEMLRVAKHGIVFVEPSHPSTDRYQPPAEYEESGNFVFRFNAFELTQIARSYGVAEVAYGYGRMFHKRGSGQITGEELSNLKKEVRELHKNWDDEYGKEHRSMLICIMMKKPMKDDFKSSLLDNRFDYFDLRR
ncbi:MAG: methyltransferase domain-containing protein [Alteromonadaceae bacterium]|nr:methyltransferase domain-containing protein [Alteromonadaceae bacterium]